MSKAFTTTTGYTIIEQWMQAKGHKPFSFQAKSWERYANGYSGMVVAPTGFGKTFSIFLAVLIDFMNQPEQYHSGMKLLWITPLRALAKDIARAMQEAIEELGLDWEVAVRNGDTEVKERQRQTKRMPDILIITPESLHLLLAQKDNARFFRSLQCIAIDEWHELLGTKRGVMTELALSRIFHFNKKIRIWGITATIGNLDEALECLIPYRIKKTKVIAREQKMLDIQAVYPETVDIMPWAGHLGAKLADQVVDIVLKSRTTLIFTNTRSQSEAWYQILLDAHPDFAGQIAIHHSSIDRALRVWIEEQLSSGSLKAVIATSSLDLGVDFKPVDTVIQIGSSKGVARFIQRAGRSGHSPNEVSKIYCVPTHSLELIEVAALKRAVQELQVEDRMPLFLCYDVLIQYLVTLAVGDGFREKSLYKEIVKTYAFRSLTPDEWQWILSYITTGGKLDQYEEYHRVVIERGVYRVTSRKIAMLHRMNIGAIVSDSMLKVKYLKGGYIGMVEEYFIARLKKDEKFILAGKVLEIVLIKDMTVFVRNAKGKAVISSYLGGRLPLTSHLSHYLRERLSLALKDDSGVDELQFLHPLLVAQADRSHIPKADELLVELIHNRDGHHLFIYPFEGRLVHEVMSSLIAFRISKIKPISFSMAMNDYGFELLSDQEIPIDESNIQSIFSSENLMNDIWQSIDAAEMAKRKFRDIAVIAGLVVQNHPGKQKSHKSLQSSAGLIYNVLDNYDKGNLLLKQAITEVFNEQIDEARLIAAFHRINNSKIIITKAKAFTPLSFPIKVDSLRQTLSSEDLKAKIEKLMAFQVRK